MRDKLKIFEYLETLVKMCRSKNDGASLKIEESDINNKIEEINLDLEELNLSLNEEIYDESAEMADRNLEIITRKSINTLKNKQKEKEEELSSLSKKEKEVTNELTIFKDNRNSYENYINTMQERVNNCEKPEIINQYQNYIRINEDRLKEENEKASLINLLEGKVANSIAQVTEELDAINSQINKKQDLLNEIHDNLKDKDSYIDVAKKNRITKKINDLEKNKQKLTERLKEIKRDPKYLEIKIKEIINDGADTFLARGYIIDLINMAMKVPYMNMPIDNNLETELLKATKARDTFANENDHKSYSLVDLENPTKIRIDYLNKRIGTFLEKQEDIQRQIDAIDNDEVYNYHTTIKNLNNIIDDIKLDISEYTTTIEKNNNYTPSVQANLKASLDEKKKELETAEYILDQFLNEECEEISSITNKLHNEYNELEEQIINAKNEIDKLNNELLSKRTDLTDIRTLNKDKARLRELASVVIDIKHRRNFPLQPQLIAKQLERMLNIEILNSLDTNEYREEQQTNSEENHNSSTLINELIKKDIDELEEQYPETEEYKPIPPESSNEPKRGIKVMEEMEISEPIVEQEETPVIEEQQPDSEPEPSKPEPPTLNEEELEAIEKELNDKLDALKNKQFDNIIEKEDNIKASDEKTNELEDFINSLEES